MEHFSGEIKAQCTNAEEQACLLRQAVSFDCKQSVENDNVGRGEG